MKLKALPIIVIVLAMCWTCKTKTPTEPELDIYTLSDLVGTWVGSTTSDGFTVDWTIEVSGAGHAEGEGTTGANCSISVTWSIDANTGEVTGGGSINGAFASSIGVGSCNFELQLSPDKRTLDGQFRAFNYDYMDTTLTKQ